MSIDGKKKTTIPLLGIIAFLAVATALVVAFRLFKPTQTLDGNAYVFDGWVYGREDRKKADSVLAAAGLTDHSWSAGKLSVPAASKKQYQAALALAGAYPKAPSETRGEALRQMSPFESDAKTRMRELDARALQLERTIEQMSGIDFATVGVYSRRENSGLAGRNVVSASIGVAAKEGREIDSDAIVAITVAARRLLGVEKIEDVAILDLKEGKSYLGFEKTPQSDEVRALEAERERIEKYWRNKYLEAFSDIENIRVTATAEIIASRSLIDGGYSEERSESPIDSSSNVKQRFSSKWESSSRDKKTGRNIEFSGIARLGAPSVAKRIADNRSDSRWVWNDSLTRSDSSTRPRILREAMDFDELDHHDRVGDNSNAAGRAKVLLVGAALRKEEEQNERASVSRATDLRDYKNLVSRDKRPVREASLLEDGNERVKTDDSREAEFKLTSILIHISLPRSYAERMGDADDLSKSSRETFASETPEERAILETKQYAVSLFLPVGERLGWDEEKIESSFIVDVYSDIKTLVDGSVLSNERPTEVEERIGARYGSFVDQENERDWSESTRTVSGETNKRDVSGEWKVDLTKEGIHAGPSGLRTDSEKNSAYAPISGKITEATAANEPDVESTVVDSTEKEPKPDLDSNVRAGDLFGFLGQYLPFDFWNRDDFRQGAFFFALGAGLILVLSLLFRGKKTIRKELKSEDSRGVDGDSMRKLSRHSLDRKVVNAVGVFDKFSTAIPNVDDLGEDEIDDELENELKKISIGNVARPDAPNIAKDSRVDEFESKRQEALDYISRYPERAAASLQSWVKGR